VPILFAGTPQNAAVTLRELLASGTPISLVLTRPDAPVGRKGVITPSPVAAVAEEFGIPVIKSNAVGLAEITEILRYDIQFAIVVALGVLLRDDALVALPKGWFNLHYSLLPRWRGAAPVQHALIAGDRETGLTVFQIDSGLDTGPVAAQLETEIQPDETAGELLSRLTNLGVSLLLETIPRIEAGLINVVPQSSLGVTSAPKLFKADGKVDLDQPSVRVSNLVRGVSPEPGAWIIFRGEPLKLIRVRESQQELGIGQLIKIEERIFVGCRSGSLELLEVQPSGKNRMSSADWFRGLQGEKFQLGEDV
jgi:methionyl-tRNA formyltransferase